MVSIKREDVPTETGKKLFDLLYASWDDPDFLTGVLSMLKGDAKKQEMIDAIESGVTDSDDIMDKAFQIVYGVTIDELVREGKIIINGKILPRKDVLPPEYVD